MPSICWAVRLFPSSWRRLGGRCRTLCAPPSLRAGRRYRNSAAPPQVAGAAAQACAGRAAGLGALRRAAGCAASAHLRSRLGGRRAAVLPGHRAQALAQPSLGEVFVRHPQVRHRHIVRPRRHAEGLAAQQLPQILHVLRCIRLTQRRVPPSAAQPTAHVRLRAAPPLAVLVHRRVRRANVVNHSRRLAPVLQLEPQVRGHAPQLRVEEERQVILLVQVDRPDRELGSGEGRRVRRHARGAAHVAERLAECLTEAGSRRSLQLIRRHHRRDAAAQRNLLQHQRKQPRPLQRRPRAHLLPPRQPRHHRVRVLRRERLLGDADVEAQTHLADGVVLDVARHVAQPVVTGGRVEQQLHGVRRAQHLARRRCVNRQAPRRRPRRL